MFNPKVLFEVQSATCAIAILPPNCSDNPHLGNTKIVGTGFLVDQETIATAAHVAKLLAENDVSGTNRFAVFATAGPDGQPSATFIAIPEMVLISRSATDALQVAPSADIALFKLKKLAPVPSLRPADESDLVIGRPVAVCAYPFGNRLLFAGSDVARFGPTFQFGYVSGMSPGNFARPDKVSGFLTSYLSAQTMSGAPVVNENGRVLGIHWGGHKPFLDRDGIGMTGYCVPFMYAMFTSLLGRAVAVFREPAAGSSAPASQAGH